MPKQIIKGKKVTQEETKAVILREGANLRGNRRFPLDGKMATFVLTEEQTLLAKQRTALSFMQTGLVFIGIGLTVAKLFSESFFQGVGILLITIGFYEIAHSYKKLGEYNQRLKRVKNFLKGSMYSEIEYGSR